MNSSINTKIAVTIDSEKPTDAQELLEVAA